MDTNIISPGYYGKCEAEAEPKAAADPYLLYGEYGYAGHQLGYAGYAGYPYVPTTDKLQTQILNPASENGQNNRQ